MKATSAAVLHKLWGKAVGTPDYVKSEWIELQMQLNATAAVCSCGDHISEDGGKCATCVSLLEDERDRLTAENALLTATLDQVRGLPAWISARYGPPVSITAEECVLLLNAALTPPPGASK